MKTTDDVGWSQTNSDPSQTENPTHKKSRKPIKKPTSETNQPDNSEHKKWVPKAPPSKEETNEASESNQIKAKMSRGPGASQKGDPEPKQDMAQ